MTVTKELTECTYGNWNLRVFGSKDEPWFVAVDVLRALGVHAKNISRELKKLDFDEKGVVRLTTPGGQQEAWLISEPGFYKIALTAQTEEAKKFQRWVTHEVLPRIRKYGYYKLTNEERRFVAYKEIAESLDANVNDLNDNFSKMPLYRLEAEAKRLKRENEEENEKEKVIEDYPYSYDEMDALCYDDLEFIKGFIDPQNQDKYYKKLSNGEEWYSEKFKREIPKFLKKGFGV